MNWRRHGRDIALVTPFFALFGLFGIHYATLTGRSYTNQ